MLISSKKSRAAAALLAASLLGAACGGSDSDGAAGVSEIESSSDSGSSGGSASASAPADGSGSGSGISADDLIQSSDNPLIQQAVDGYRDYIATQVAELQTETTVFTDAIRAGDIDAAKAQFPISRAPWERIEPIAGIIEDIDGAVDSRADDLDADDPDFTGWHKLEYLLWEKGDISDAAGFADMLDADLQTLADAIPGLELPAGVLTVGAQELIEEVAAPDGKLSGEEDRYSHTDIWDFKANVEGSEALVQLLKPALEEANPELLAELEGLFGTLNGQLAELEDGSGYVSYEDVTEEQKNAFADTLSELAEELAELNGVLGLE